MSGSKPRTISLMQYAHAERLSYQQALTKVLRHEVEGVKRGRHWRVVVAPASQVEAGQAAAQTEGASRDAA